MFVRSRDALKSISCDIEADYRLRLKSHNKKFHLGSTGKCRWISASLAAYPGSLAALKASAPIYTALRGGQVLFARHDGKNLIVESAGGFGPYDKTYFEGPRMCSLMLQLLAERFSLLIGSFDKRKYPDELPVSLFYGTDLVERQTLSNWALGKFTPVALSGVESGQALITPLELANTASLSFGLIYEYRSAGFSRRRLSREISEARVYASAFMAEIARRIASNR